jgi:HAD superfamily hydrolase (TIGR01490 family)
MTSHTNNSIKVALFDVCHTLVRVTTITDFTERFLLSREHNPTFRLRKKLYHVWYKKMKKLHLVSEAAYRNHFVRLLRGYTVAEVEVVARNYTTELQTRIKEPVWNELSKLRDLGYSVYLVSAGLDVYLKLFGALLNVPLICTVLEVKDGRYTGRIDGIDCIGVGKVEKVKNEVVNFETVDWKESVAYGDSVSDIPVLSLVGASIVVDPNPTLRAHAEKMAWSILKTNNTCASGSGCPIL